MALKLFKKPQILNEFVKICEKNEYFSANINRNVIKDIKFLKHTPNLEANIERQWFGQSQNIENNLKTFSNVDFKDYGNNLTLLEKNSVVWKRDRLSRSTPFGLIETVNQKQEPPVETDLDEKTIDLHFDGNVKYWICSYLLNEKQSQEYFYRIQRLRKIWWMKYAANPGRFMISKTKHNEEDNTKLVTIKANYPFGNIEIEKIELLPLPSIQSIETNNKGTTPTKVVKTTTSSEVATIETIFDAIDAGDFGEMCLHRKIAPHQITLYIFNEDKSTVDDLEDLAKYIEMLLQRSNISVLNNPDHIFKEKSSLARKCNEMDSIGVPYGLILNEDSLRTGMLKLRNRDTTLSETIHISYLNDYVPKIFQS